jgi:hypothetical protein
MVDVTAMVLAQSTDVMWEKHLYHGLIGSTLGAVAHIALFDVDGPIQLARRSLAAMLIGVACGPLSATVIGPWLKMEVNSILLIPVCAALSMAGPAAVKKYGENAIEKGAEYFHLKSGAEEQHSVKTPDNRNDDTVNGK